MYGDLNIIYQEPYSTYLTGTIRVQGLCRDRRKLHGARRNGGRRVLVFRDLSCQLVCSYNIRFTWGFRVFRGYMKVILGAYGDNGKMWKL